MGWGGKIVPSGSPPFDQHPPEGPNVKKHLIVTQTKFRH